MSAIPVLQKAIRFCHSGTFAHDRDSCLALRRLSAAHLTKCRYGDDRWRARPQPEAPAAPVRTRPSRQAARKAAVEIVDDGPLGRPHRSPRNKFSIHTSSPEGLVPTAFTKGHGSSGPGLI
jgi:hypothetical protein